jgi:iron complex outermembrane receptor protein
MANPHFRGSMAWGGLSLSVLALTLASAAGAQTSDAAPTATIPSGADAAAQATGPEVVITGTLLRNIRQEDRASPVLSATQADIAKTGVVSLGDLTRFIPQNVGSQGGMQDLAKGGVDTRDARSANLRGLGAGATLVLLNGRRVIPSEGYVNLNSLTPEIAISRVETVLDGASSTYGADAVAGVVNVITNTSFKGLKVSGQFTHIANSPQGQVSAMVGIGSGGLHSVTSIEFRAQDNLQNAERRVTNFFNPSAGAGANPGSFTLTSRPHTASGGDVIINGNNYSTLYDRYKSAAGTLTVVDPGCGAPGTDSLYTPLANGPAFGLGTCQFSYQAQNPIRPEAKSLLVHNDTSYDIGAGQTLYAELAFYHQDSRRYGVPAYAQNHNGPQPPIVPASNPYNPFGVDVGWIGRALGALSIPGTPYNVQRDTVNQRHVVLGARGDISDAGHWNYTADFTWSRAEIIHRDHDTDMRLFQAALNGFGGPNCNQRFNGPGSGAQPGVGNCLYFSPFEKDDLKNDPSLIFNIQSDEFAETRNEYLIGEGVVNGTLADIGGRPLNVAVGAQYRKEHQNSRYSDLYLNNYGAFNGPARNTNLSREVKSVFAEANYSPFDGLSIDLAARYEDYGGFKAKAPKLAVNWRAAKFLSLRGSISKAFQAPSIANSSNSLIGTGVGNVIDPIDHSVVFRSIQTYGNPNLKPQKADVYNIGTTLLPLAGARFSVDYWHYKYNNQIQLQNAQAIINADPLGPAVIRDANGVAQSVIVTSFNAPSGTKTSGLDFAGQYSFDLARVNVTLRDNLSYLLRYDVDTGSTVYDGVGHRNNYQTSPGSAAAAPRWRNIGAVDLGMGNHYLTADVRYISSVIDDYQIVLGQPVTRPKVGSWAVVDWQYALRFGSKQQFEASIGMINAFDRAPPKAVYTGYLSSLEDPYGRQAYIRLSAKF